MEIEKNQELTWLKWNNSPVLIQVVVDKVATETAWFFFVRKWETGGKARGALIREGCLLTLWPRRILRIWSSIERVCPFPNFLWHARKATQLAECGVSNEGAQSEWIMLFRERSWPTGSARTLLLVNKITTEKAQLIYRCRIRTLSYSTYN